MKGTYINTVIMMAALSGKKSKTTTAYNEAITSLNNFKLIWSKNSKSNKTAADKSKAASIN